MGRARTAGYNVIDVDEGHFGKKVIAIRPLTAGTRVIRFTGKAMRFEETKKQDDKESFALQTGIDSYVYLNPPCCYFNHCCEPNCGLTPELDLILLRDVTESDELTYDYSTTMFERSWTMVCSAESPAAGALCRTSTSCLPRCNGITLKRTLCRSTSCS